MLAMLVVQFKILYQKAKLRYLRRQHRKKLEIRGTIQIQLINNKAHSINITSKAQVPN